MTSHNQCATILETIGRNGRIARERHGWSAERFADEATQMDLGWEPSDVAKFEAGQRNLSVREFVAFAAVVGVAPQVLLYPTQSDCVDIGPGAIASEDHADEMEEAILLGETHLRSGEFADWLWSPDDSPLSRAGIHEQDEWNAAVSQESDA